MTAGAGGGVGDGNGDDWPGDWRFLRARITETIATTRPATDPDDEGDASGDPAVNVAPMGLVSEPGEPDAVARLWAGSDTLANVRATGRVTVNFTRDPLVYARAALSDDTGAFVADGRLDDPDAWVDCDAVHAGEERGGEVERWRLEPRDGALLERRLCQVDRGFGALVDACVDATRLHVDPALDERIAERLSLAWRCGDDRCREAATYVSNFTDISFRKKDS